MLSAGFASSGLVSTVLMATLVVGPFYLSRALGLDPALVGIVMSAGPLVAALTGRRGAWWTAVAPEPSSASPRWRQARPSWRWFRRGPAPPATSRPSSSSPRAMRCSTAAMADARPDQRGALSGLLNLSRNLGLITGASVMGAVFALASGADITTASPQAVAAGMRFTFRGRSRPDRRRAGADFLKLPTPAGPVFQKLPTPAG